MNNNTSALSAQLQLTSCQSGHLQFDTHVGVVQNAAEDSIRLSPILLKVLACLLESGGQVVTRADLFDRVWPNQIVNDDVLTRVISDLRTHIAKLDDSTKYIETLPRRGYRWVLPVVRDVVVNAEGNNLESASQLSAINNALQASAPAKFKFPLLNRRLLKKLLGYSFSAVLLSVCLMLLISQFAISGAYNLAVLPAQAEHPSAQPAAQSLDDALAFVLRKNRQVKLLSKSAIASRPANPFPYFSKEFNARWVLESHISDVDGISSVELSLVDAHSGIELRSLRFEANGQAELLSILAKKVEADLLVESLGY